VLGPALERLNQWANVESTGGAMPGTDGRQHSAAEVRAIRESLETASRAGRVSTEEDALDFVAMKVINGGWALSINEEEAIA
jgi:hypothetical protein